QDWLRADSRPVSVEEDPVEIDKIDEELSNILRTIGISDIALPPRHATPTPTTTPCVESACEPPKRGGAVAE
ncbi:hypothetical protein LINGRAHAP2_LOCUS34712, partial [Linum grandiflorum]